MGQIKKGDVVARRSYQEDIFFKVEELKKESQQAVLKGLFVRLYADAPIDDLVKKDVIEVSNKRRTFVKKNNEHLQRIYRRRGYEKKNFLLRNQKKVGFEFFELPGRVLHLDGDEEYCQTCFDTYRQLGIKALAVSVAEKEQPQVVVQYLQEVRPDILVLTGHDGFIKGRKSYTNINNYRTSSYFVEAVSQARSYEPALDNLVIFAGGCQSYYEAILDAGANFASSPERILIQVLDPVYFVEKLAFTSIDRIVSVRELAENTATGLRGIGGLESRGKYRLGLPKSVY